MTQKKGEETTRRKVSETRDWGAGHETGRMEQKLFRGQTIQKLDYVGDMTIQKPDIEATNSEARH